MCEQGLGETGQSYKCPRFLCLLMPAQSLLVPLQILPLVQTEVMTCLGPAQILITGAVMYLQAAQVYCVQMKQHNQLMGNLVLMQFQR